MPVNKRTEELREITVQKDRDILFSVIIGNAQIGSSVAKFKFTSDILAKGKITDLVLGKGSAITGKILRVVTRVLDANDATNKVVVTHAFTNAAPASNVYEDEVADSQDVFTLITDYKFI
jgi:hypothetical protein